MEIFADDQPPSVPAIARAALAPVAPPPAQNPALVYLARLAPNSRRVMRSALDVIAAMLTNGRLDAETCPWPALRYQHTAALRAQLADRYAPSTANQHLSALRGVLREAWRLGHMDAETFHRAADLAAVRGEPLPAGRELATGELRALFDTVSRDDGPIGARDAALLAILYSGGLRRSEAVSLDLADVDAQTGAIAIRRGKGNKGRTAYATSGAREAVVAWIAVRGSEPGPLLCPVTKGGRIVSRRLTAQTVYDVLKRRAEQAGVNSFSPHDCRRTFVSHLLDRGADISTVQRMAGHANASTTARYDRRGEETKRKAAELLHVPYSKPTDPRGKR